MLRTLLLPSLVLTAALALFAQDHASPFCNPPLVPNVSGQGCHHQTPEEARREKERDKEQAHQRYVDMQRDSAKLLELATDLKNEVDSAGEDKLSLDVVKKADSIEKLARSVKQRMKGD